jgi:hypothetical protein
LAAGASVVVLEVCAAEISAIKMIGTTMAKRTAIFLLKGIATAGFPYYPAN